jgi:peptide/nickel transport system permease protein
MRSLTGLTRGCVWMLRRNWKLFLFLAALAIVPYALLAIGRASDPYAIETSHSYLAPGRQYPFGTDGLGRDMLARTLYATGLSLKVVVQSVGLSFILALILGGLAGYTQGRWPDLMVTWLISLLYTVPFILIVVAIFAVLEPGIGRAYIVIGCIGWAAPARLIRAEVMQIRSSPFILAEKAYGMSEAQILIRSVLPLSLMPAVVSLLFYIPELIGIEVGLSFFGLSAQPPTPSLGRLIYEGLSDFYTGWWLSVLPATVMLICMFAIYKTGLMLTRSNPVLDYGP